MGTGDRVLRGQSSEWAFAGTSVSGNSAAAAGALRLENGRWKLVKAFSPGIVTGCLVLSPTEVWVFGDAHVAPGTGTWHLHGHTWTHLAYQKYALDGASAISQNDVWGGGETGFGVPVVARWNGRAWVRNTPLAKALPTAQGLSIEGITAISDHDVWLRVLVTHTHPKPGNTNLVLHWNGHAWLKVGPANPGYYLPGAVPDGHGGWWSYPSTNPYVHLAGAVRHEVSGHWVKVPVRIAGCPGSLPYLLTRVGGSATMLGLQLCPAASGSVTHVLAYGSVR